MNPTTPEVTRNASTSLLAIIAAVLVIAALKWSQSVTLPLAFAIFIVALAWPLQNKLAEKMPHKAAFGMTLLCALLIFALFCGGLYFCGALIVSRAPEYSDEARQMYGGFQEWARAQGFSIPGSDELASSFSSGSGGSRLSTFKSAMGRFLSVLGLFVLTFAFLALGLMDARRIREKLERSDSSDSDRWHQTLHKMTEKFQRYFLVRTGISAIQGVCTFFFSLVIGLDFALVWGVMSALLNYIPTLGSLVAVLPPTLWALFQFQSPLMAAVVFFGNCIIQVLLGSFVDPLLEGKQLQLSPLAVLFSIAFWGWVWGVGGALIGVPITVAIVIVCHEFDQLSWLAELLTSETGENAQQSAEN